MLGSPVQKNKVYLSDLYSSIQDIVIQILVEFLNEMCDLAFRLYVFPSSLDIALMTYLFHILWQIFELH